MRKFTQITGIFFSVFLLVGLVRAGDPGFESLRDETFEAAWRQVGTSYYDAEFGGLDWDEVGNRFRSRLAGISEMEELRSLIWEMLYELGESHLSLVSSEFDQEELNRPWGGGTAGVDLCYDGDRVVFYRVEEGGAAYRSGIRAGDTLLVLDGLKIKAFRNSVRATGQPEHLWKYSAMTAIRSRLNTMEGARVQAVVRTALGKRRSVTVELDRYVGRKTEPFGRIGRMPFDLETQRLEDGSGYVRFSLWFPAAMPDIRAFVGSLPDDVPGLVIDLRGNPGGMMVMAGGLAGLVLDEQSELGRTTLREGHINVVGFPQKNRFSGKVALLVDETSASTSEVFAIGLQEIGRVRVFGQPTPGAALPSVFFALPNGDSLQIALGDFRTPAGVSLEARGVIPDEVVNISPVDLSRGKDTVLLSALNWIHKTN